MKEWKGSSPPEGSVKQLQIPRFDQPSVPAEDGVPDLVPGSAVRWGSLSQRSVAAGSAPWAQLRGQEAAVGSGAGGLVTLRGSATARPPHEQISGGWRRDVRWKVTLPAEESNRAV